LPRSPRRARGSTGASGTVTFAAAGGNLHGTSFATVRPTFASDRLLQELLSDGVVIRATPVSTGSSPVLTALITILPVLVIGGLVIWFFRRSSGAQGRSMLGSYGKSNAKRYDGAGQRTTFADVAGIDEATDELGEIVDFLRHPDRYRRMVGRWGMSRNIGLVSALPRPGEESMFAGGGLTSQRTLQAIDDEVKRLTD
jgi:ATP-dependent Zn protease